MHFRIEKYFKPQPFQVKGWVGEVGKGRVDG
jgi:hypothetical protein